MESYQKFLKSKLTFRITLLALGALLLSVPFLFKYNLSFPVSLLIVAFFCLTAIIIIGLYKRSVDSRFKNLRIRFNRNDLFWLENNIPFYRVLDNQEKLIFQDRLGLFLSEIAITEVGKPIPEKSTCLYVGSSAIIAYWGLPYWNYGELREVLVYPTNFTDEKIITSSGNILGQVHHGGLMNNTMILSYEALVKGFKNTTDGRNVGVHEFSHLLDKEDGTIDGLPVGLSQSERVYWLKVFKTTLNCDRFKLDKYAKSNNAEFFAVAGELYKESPERLKKWHPELFDILDEYFN